MAAASPLWSSRFGFLMAAIGFAVGLGNIWRFPYVAGENGGAAFVLVYLLCVFAIGVPILIAEIMLGRAGLATPPTSIARLATGSGRSHRWGWLGHLNLLTAFTIQMVYAVVAGWVLYYFYLSVVDGFADYDGGTARLAFDSLLQSPGTLLGWALVPLLAAAGIVYAGVQKGIERAVVVLMPLLFVLMLGLAVFNIFAGGMGDALAYLFTPDFSKVSAQTVLAAIGQAFFSMGVAMAGMMMFGAYLPKRVGIASSAVIIALADTLVAVVAGLVIFPMVFANGLDPAGGAGLIFVTLPVAFAQMAPVVAVVFFLLLSVAGITSLVGLFEPVAAWLMERWQLSRHRAVLYLVVATLGGSVVSVLSYSVWAGVHVFGASLESVLDFIPNQLFLPLGGLLIAGFVGFGLARKVSQDELALPGSVFALWYSLLRFVVVPALVIILFSGLFT